MKLKCKWKIPIFFIVICHNLKHHFPSTVFELTSKLHQNFPDLWEMVVALKNRKNFPGIKIFVQFISVPC